MRTFESTTVLDLYKKHFNHAGYMGMLEEVNELFYHLITTQQPIPTEVVNSCFLLKRFVEFAKEVESHPR